jgi:multicomponent Na+:H+ antiporter subunit B
VSRRVRIRLFLVAAVGLAALLALGLAGLPDAGRELPAYAEAMAYRAVPERHATNTVIVVAFDYRALDTLGEEFLLFVAAVGSTALLRTEREERGADQAEVRAERSAPATSDLVRAFGTALSPFVVLFALYVVAHGHLTPGGGFQGGVALGAALFVVFVAGNRHAMSRAGPVGVLDAAEAAGAAGFALVGLGGLVFAGAVFENFLPLGTSGDLLSGGTVPLGNVAVGLEVAGAFALILSELLDQPVQESRSDE